MAVKTIVMNEVDDFDLPTEMTVPETNMDSCILFGQEKCGKTTALAQLKNCLIIDTENGSKKIAGLVKRVPDNLGPVAKMQWLEKLADKLIADGKPYDYVAVDTFTKIDEWAEWSGTYRYMNTAQGKKFNRVDGAGSDMLKPSDPDYVSVHTLPEGYGYRWSREDTLRLFDKFMNVAKKCVFFVCHVEDKYVGQKENVEVIVPKQLALTGKIRNILPRRVDGIGYIYNDDGVVKINFTGSEEKVGGNRCEHLRGYNDVLDWSKIFI